MGKCKGGPPRRRMGRGAGRVGGEELVMTNWKLSVEQIRFDIDFFYDWSIIEVSNEGGYYL
jgi:hypothetical protein